MKTERIGISRKDIKCPICGNPTNWLEPVGNYHYNHRIVLLAECWNENTLPSEPKARHLFLVELKPNTIPMVKKRTELRKIEIQHEEESDK